MASAIAVDAIRGKTCRPWAEGPGPGRKGRQVWARLWGCVQHSIVIWFQFLVFVTSSVLTPWHIGQARQVPGPLAKCNIIQQNKTYIKILKKQTKHWFPEMLEPWTCTLYMCSRFKMCTLDLKCVQIVVWLQRVHWFENLNCLRLGSMLSEQLSFVWVLQVLACLFIEKTE